MQSRLASHSVQYFFGMLTVASFIMIVLMSMQTPNKRKPVPSSCSLQVCRIVCNDTTPSLYEDVLAIVTDSEMFCPRLSLAFLNPTFENETIPAQWMSNLRSSIYRLAIIRGNLKHIEPQAFMTLFASNIELIFLEGITITNWTPDTFVGLANLRQLHIKNVNIIDVRENALRPVDETLDVLTITRSGKWNPMNITGSNHVKTLETVDFSFNRFDNILSNVSFNALRHCKVLYLNSCKITAIARGTFDSMHNIEIIYLNNNLLVTIPTGLFDVMANRLNPKPRVNLQNNPWYCDCESHYLKYLNYNGLLYVDPTCDTPKELHGYSFSALSKYCTNDSYVIVANPFELQNKNGNNTIMTFGSSCNDEINSNKSWKLMTPNQMYSCDKNITLFSIGVLLTKANVEVNEDITNSDWITPTYMVRKNGHSMVQLTSLTSRNYGIVWFKTLCPKEIYCMATLPKFLRIYDHYIDSQFTFCPIDLDHGFVRNDKCVDYSMLTKAKPQVNVFGSLFLYICTSLICLTFGAVLVYGIVRYNPVLLKGSKRLLFVKHKNVDALVLPPKVPLRQTLSNSDPDPKFNLGKVCVFQENENNLSPRNFVRMKSTRSDKSTVSYISALQPTEDQLAEWRVKRHFDNNVTVSSDSEMSIISWINDGSSSSEYFSSITYESLK